MNLAKRLKCRRMKTYNLSTPEGHKLPPGESLCLLDVKGPGQVTRLHLTNNWNDPLFPRNALLKIYWDGESLPSILCPVGDFFCDPFCGQGISFATEFFCNWGKHWYCYLPMPFSNGCKIEIESQSQQEDTCVAYDATVEEWDSTPDDLLRLHACWRRENPTRPSAPYTVLNTTGSGHFVGMNLSVQALDTPSLSFLEGMSFVYADGRGEPELKLWGTEDFLGGSFYFCKGPYAGPYSGCTLRDVNTGRFAGYRLFIKDAIPFNSSIRVMLNHGDPLRSGSIYSYEGRSDYSSVAYWYQSEPHNSSGYQGLLAKDRMP